MRPARFPTASAAVALCALALAAAILSASGQELSQADRDHYESIRRLQAEGAWGEARDLARALVARHESGPPSRHRLAFTNELANLEQRLGDYAAARRGYETAREIAAATEGDASALVAQLGNNLAALHQVLGDFETAESLSREALDLRERLEGKGSPGTVPAVNNLAGLLWCIGDHAGAEALYREAVAIRERHLGPRHLDTNRSKANLGGLLYYENRIEEAAPLVREAAEVFLAEAGPQHPDTLETLLFLGEIERATGQAGEALALYQQVREGRVAAFGEAPHVKTAEALSRIGDALRELGRYGEALPSYELADGQYLRLLAPAHPDRIPGLYGAGLAALSDGRASLAREHARTLGEIEFATLAAVLEFTDERQRLAYQGMFRSHHLLANLGDGPGVAEFLLRRKGVVLDSLIGEARLASRARRAGAEAALAELAEARAAFRAAYLAGLESGLDRERSQQRVREAQRALIAQTGGLGHEVSLDLALADLQRALGPGETLVDYLVYDRYLGGASFERRYAAAIVTSVEARFADCAPVSEVDRLIDELVPYFAYSDDPSDELAESVLKALHRLLVAPLGDALAETATLYLCPEEKLNFVPFACLLDESGRFLVERHDLGYLSAARELLRSPAPRPEGGGALLVGNPDFSRALGTPTTRADRRGLLAAVGVANLAAVAESLFPLEGTKTEVDRLGALLRDAGIPVASLVGGEATESALRERVRRPLVLHLATHGIYLPALGPSPEETRPVEGFVPEGVAGFQNPLFGSWLALSGSRETVDAWARGEVPDPAADGILMANEAAELDLEGTLLVTLSACDTATGEAVAGDGVLGIRRGFRLAGAEHLLSTLWPISDEMTVTVMDSFYRQLLQRSPLEALSATQREWLVKLRDDPAAVTLSDADGNPVAVGGLYYAVNLGGAFLLSR